MRKNIEEFCGVVLFQIKKRKKDAGEPAKYMGCGDCDNFSRSITVSWYHIGLYET